MPHPPRILITRAPHQASALADAVRSIGAESILIPTIKIADPTSFSILDAALTRLDTFNWLLFTSANAVTAFYRRLQQSSEPWTLNSNPCLVAAIGRATAEALTAIGLPPDLVPPHAVAESLTEALLPYALQPDGIPTRFLLIRAEEAREHLPETLRAAGAEITIAPAYRSVVPVGSLAALRTLFSDAPPDAIILTSSSTARNLFKLLDGAGLTIPPETGLISFGPITSATIREHGRSVAAEARESTIPSLLETLVKHLAARSTQ